MDQSLSLGRSISPWLEMGSYEALWKQGWASFKKLAECFREKPDAAPSDLVPRETAEKTAHEALEILRKANVRHFGLRIHKAGEYPERLRDAHYPVELLYYRGWWDLIQTRCVAVVGTRKPTPEGQARAARLVKSLVEDKFTIVSGLAAGIDTIAHRTAIECGARTVGVIGTPLSHSYPAANKHLQEQIAQDYLLISQVPIVRYSQQGWKINRLFFPERNVTMSALTEATIIVEASETSGTLIQARAAIHQERKLFILDNCFKNPELTWPARFESQGAIRVRDYEDIRTNLASTP